MKEKDKFVITIDYKESEGWFLKTILLSDVGINESFIDDFKIFKKNENGDISQEIDINDIDLSKKCIIDFL